MRIPSIALLVLVACASTPRAPVGDQKFKPSRSGALASDPSVRQRLLAAAPEVERYLGQEIEKLGFPSAAVGLIHGRELIWFHGFGTRAPGSKDPITEHTVFRIGSVTKVFAGLALLQLRDSGRVSFDQPAASYLPELDEILYPTRDSPRITLRHIVTHSSGLPRLGSYRYDQADRDVTEAEVLGALRDLPLDFVPGTSSSYSNQAVGLVGPLVTRVSGMPFREYMRKNLFEPLQMTSTGWARAEVPESALATGHRKKDGKYVPDERTWRFGASEAIGGLYSTVADLARFVGFELSAWPPRDEPDVGPVRRSSLRESQLVFGHAPARARGFGVNWVVFHDDELGHLVFHNGSTEDYGASVWLLPQRGLGLVLLVGAGDDAEQRDAMARTALHLFATSLPKPEPVLGDAAEVALEKVIRLMGEPSAVRLEDVLSSRALAQIPAAQWRSVFEAVHQQLGACRRGKVLQARGAAGAIVQLDCVQGTMKLTFVAGTAAPHHIEMLSLESVDARNDEGK